jgi:hypothetical protein
VEGVVDQPQAGEVPDASAGGLKAIAMSVNRSPAKLLLPEYSGRPIQARLRG